MFFNFFLTYKKNLVSASKKYNLQCNWISHKNFMLRYYITFAEYFGFLLKGNNIPMNLFKRVYNIQEKHFLEDDISYYKWKGTVMPKNKLEEMMCGWIATAQTINADAKDYVKDMIEDVEISDLSKGYLLNKSKVL